MEFIIKIKGATQVHRKHIRETPNEKKNRKDPENHERPHQVKKFHA